MSTEPKTTEAEPKTPGDLTASIARMTACLERVRTEVHRALGEVELMPRDGMKWMRLSKAVFDVHELTRMGWQKIVDPAAGTGAYFTPKSALDFVLANPPLNIPPAPEPIDPNAPKMVRGEKPPFTRCTLVNIPEIGIEFQQFYTEEYFHAACHFHNKEGDQHVYEVTVRPFPNGEGEIGRWHANCMADGATKFILESKSKSIAIECALTAMRRYLVRGHRCAWRTARRLAKQQALNSKAAAPLSPEEELADTIKRQKEEVQA